MIKSRRAHRILPAVLGLFALGVVLVPSVALGSSQARERRDNDEARAQTFRFDLETVPDDPRASGGAHATGRARITVQGDQVTVRLRASGLSPNMVHVQHIHGVGQNRCPDASRRDDRVNDGLIDTVEGLPDYGAIQVSLTTTGDTSAASGLAVDRFPRADEHGRVRYERTFTIGVDFPREVAEHLAEHHIVTHGIDVNHNGAYDFGAGVSALSPALPLEAELPAACGLSMHHHV
jgi:hypothetical protein